MPAGAAVWLTDVFLDNAGMLYGKPLTFQEATQNSLRNQNAEMLTINDFTIG